MKNLIRLLLVIGLFILLAACSDTEINPDREVQESLDASVTEISNTDYRIVKGKIFYVLVDEYLQTNDQNNHNVHVMFREYRVYDGNRNNIYPNIESVSLPKEVETISQAKDYLQSENAEWLKLKRLTIISKKVLNQWKNEGYEGKVEYWNGSPKRLTLEKIIKAEN